MKITIFGASGGIGQHAVEHALNAGYEVNAFVRHPEKVKVVNDRLHVIQGSIDNYTEVSAAIEGSDAVVWCVGIPMRKYVGTPSLDGHRVLLRAMKAQNISRLIDWGTPSIHFERDTKSFVTVVPGMMAGIVLRQAKEEMQKIGELLQESDVNFTLVRFMAPKDTAYTGEVKVGFGDVKMKFAISRADIGAFMIDQIQSAQYLRSMPIIGS